MELARYRELFLAESREHLGAAFALQLRLESSPAQRQALAEMLRHAHSLKGMAGTLGEAPMVELAHAVEELLARLQGDSESDVAGALPLVADALACLGEMVDQLEHSGQATSDRAAGVTRSLRDCPVSLVTAREARPTPAVRAPERPVPSPLLPEPRLWRVELRLDDDPARSVRGTVAVLGRAARLGRVIQVDPARLSRRTGRFEGRLGLLLSSALEPLVLAEELRRIEGVREAGVEPLAPIEAAQGCESTASWVRVRADRLEAIADELTELGRAQGRLQAALALGPLAPLVERTSSHIKKACRAVLELRLVPFAATAQRLHQTVRELATQLGKQVRVEIEGADVRIDRGVLDELTAPLLHVARNAVDHGLESPAERLGAGKPATGSLRLSLERSGERVVLCLADDGRGIDTDSLRRQARERGLVEPDQLDALDEAAALHLVTLPGLSTTEHVTHVSGRGIGMDVVQHTIERLGGRLELASSPGRGTEVRLIVPARQALLQALLVRSSGVLYALPLDRVSRALAADDVASRPPGCRATRLESEPQPESDGAAPILAGTWLILIDDTERGVTVDEILGPRELVVQPLPPPLGLLRRYAGAAVLEDGSIALVPDLTAG